MDGGSRPHDRHFRGPSVGGLSRKVSAASRALSARGLSSAGRGRRERHGSAGGVSGSGERSAGGGGPTSPEVRLRFKFEAAARLLRRAP